MSLTEASIVICRPLKLVSSYKITVPIEGTMQSTKRSKAGSTDLVKVIPKMFRRDLRLIPLCFFLGGTALLGAADLIDDVFSLGLK